MSNARMVQAVAADERKLRVVAAGRTNSILLVSFESRARIDADQVFLGGADAGRRDTSASNP